MQRRKLQELSASERAELASLIRTYVTPALLQEHIHWHSMHGPGGTHGLGSGAHFLQFHREFIQKLEKWLIAQEKQHYVPLPYWNPATPIPPEFFHAGRNTDIPNVPVPSWASAAGGTTPDPIFGCKSLKEFTTADQLGRALADEFHGLVHLAIGGDMDTFSSPRDPIFFPFHAFLDDLWSEWESVHAIPPPPPPGDDASIIISPTSGHIGTVAEITGSNFPANVSVTVKLDGTSITTNPTSITTTKIGSFTAAITIPNVTVGSHTVRATAGTKTTDAKFTVTRVKHGRCFIATAAYGSELAPPVQFLREFRDNVILRSRYRSVFEVTLEIYYRLSPPIAEAMRRHSMFKYIMRYLAVWPVVIVLRICALIIA